MADDRHTISAGKHDVYEVIQHDDGSITIGVIGNETNRVQLLAGVRASLIRILEKMRG